MPQHEMQRRQELRRRRVPEVYMPAMPPLDLFAAIGRWLRGLMHRLHR